MVKRKKRDNVPCLITWTHERKEIKVTKCYTRNRRRVTQGRGRKIEREDAPWRSRAGLESRLVDSFIYDVSSCSQMFRRGCRPLYDLMRGDSGTRGFAARSGRWGCLFMLAPALTCFSFCPVVPAQEQGDGVPSGGGDENVAGQQGKMISWLSACTSLCFQKD